MPIDVLEAEGILPPLQNKREPIDVLEAEGLAPPLADSQKQTFDQERQGMLGRFTNNLSNPLYHAAWGAGHALGEIPSNLLHIAGNVGIPGAEKGAKAWESILGSGPPPGLAGSAGHLGGDILGMLATDGASKVLSAGAEIPGIAGQLVKALGSDSGPEAAARRMLGMTGYGAVQNPNDPTQGALTGMVSGGIGEAIPINKIAQGGDILMGALKNRTSPEAEQFYKQVGGLPIPYASQDYYLNRLGNVPWSGVGKQVGQVQDEFSNVSQQLLQKLKGTSSMQDLSSSISDQIKATGKKIQSQKNDKYDQMADIANSLDAKVNETPKLNESVSEFISDPLYGLSGDFVKSISDFSKQKTMTFPEAIGQIKRFNRIARTKGDDTESMILKSMSASLKQDVEDSAQKTNSPEVMDALNKANQFYVNEYLPYKDNSIQSILRGKQNLETIQNTLSRDNDVVNKVISDLPSGAKEKVALLRLKNSFSQNPETGEYEANPRKLMSGYQRLSETQKQNLLDDDTRDLFQKLNFLGSKAYGTTYARPEGRIMGTAAAIGSVLPASELLIHGNPMASMLSAAGMGGYSGLANLNAKLLTNPRLGRSYLSAPQGLKANPRISDMLKQALGVSITNPLSPQQGMQ